MGNCASGKSKQGSSTAEQQREEMPEHPQRTNSVKDTVSSAAAPDPLANASADPAAADLQNLAVRNTLPSSTASSEAAARPRQDSSFDRTGAASSEDSRFANEYTSSPLSSQRRTQQLPMNPTSNPLLTESALNELNQSASARRGKPSSTGGTTANTRPTEAPDLPELVDVPEASEIPHSASPAGDPGAILSADVAAGTPPPVAEGLPVVSLQDIAVMEQKQGRRGRRMRSRRGSTTASHASLSAIPENVEITPLHARSERSDSMRVPLAAHPVSRLADVQELDIESKTNTGGSRPSGFESPRSSSSVLTSGDDSVMPHAVELHVEHQYEMLVPVQPRPSPYWRYPNATEAYRAAHRSLSGRHLAPPTPPASAGASPLGPAPQSLTQHSIASHFPAAASPSPLGRPSGGGSFHMHAEGLVERVLTDDTGMQLLGSKVDLEEGKVVELGADQLALSGTPIDSEASLPTDGAPRLEQGTSQQERLRFSLPHAVTGLRCVKKYAVGELSWDQTILMGDFDAGEHEYQFEPSTVPSGKLTLGKYCMKTVFMDAHGQYLWAGVNTFEVVPLTE